MDAAGFQPPEHIVSRPDEGERSETPERVERFFLCRGCGLPVRRHGVVRYGALAGAPTDGTRRGTAVVGFSVWHRPCAQAAERYGAAAGAGRGHAGGAARHG